LEKTNTQDCLHTYKYKNNWRFPQQIVFRERTSKAFRERESLV
jgi:hypothetical protein